MRPAPSRACGEATWSASTSTSARQPTARAPCPTRRRRLYRSSPRLALALRPRSPRYARSRPPAPPAQAFLAAGRRRSSWCRCRAMPHGARVRAGAPRATETRRPPPVLVVETAPEAKVWGRWRHRLHRRRVGRAPTATACVKRAGAAQPWAALRWACRRHRRPTALADLRAPYGEQAAAQRPAPTRARTRTLAPRLPRRLARWRGRGVAAAAGGDPVATATRRGRPAAPLRPPAAARCGRNAVVAPAARRRTSRRRRPVAAHARATRPSASLPTTRTMERPTDLKLE